MGIAKLYLVHLSLFQIVILSVPSCRLHAGHSINKASVQGSFARPCLIEHLNILLTSYFIECLVLY